MSPNLAVAHWQRGATLIFSGQPMKGLDALETCIRLDPRDPFMSVRLLHIARGLYFAREYEGVVDAAKRLIRSYPDFPMIYRWPAAALGQLGRAAEAKEWLEKAISYAPTAFKMYVHNRVPWFRPEDHAHLIEVCARRDGRADALAALDTKSLAKSGGGLARSASVQPAAASKSQPDEGESYSRNLVTA